MSFDNELDEVADEVARRGAEQFRQRAIEILRETGGRIDYDVEPVINSFTPVTQMGDGYGFTVTHPASVYMEFGTDEHIIEPDDPEGVLAFEQNGETVFAKRVEHPGTEAILFVSKAKQELDAKGLERRFSR